MTGVFGRAWVTWLPVLTCVIGQRPKPSLKHPYTSTTQQTLNGVCYTHTQAGKSSKTPYDSYGTQHKVCMVSIAAHAQ